MTRHKENVLTNAGWDEAAISVYRAATEQQPTDTTLADSLFLIGSPLYEKMFDALHLSATAKLTHLLHQLEATIDQHQFLQLSGPHRIDPELPPHALFFSKLRRSVQLAFPTAEGLGTSPLGRKVHLFRSYIDQHNMTYIRTHYDGKTDYEKLQHYLTDFKLSCDYTTGANFHNRAATDFRFPANMKLQIPKKNTAPRPYKNTRMAEFIVEIATGRFVSEWNCYTRLTNGHYQSDPAAYHLPNCRDIANTASFNYGVSHGQNHDVAKNDYSHRRLDVQHPIDPSIRKQATRLWKSEGDFNKTGNYADLVKRGPRDVSAWQAIPVTQQDDMYQAFLAFCRNKRRNKGFHRFYRQLPHSKKRRTLTLVLYAISICLLLLILWLFSQLISL